MRPDTAPVNCELGLLRPLVFAGSTPPDRRVRCCGFANKALWSRSLGLPATYDDSFTLMTLRTFWSCLRFDVHTHTSQFKALRCLQRPEPLASIFRNRAQHEPPSQPSLSLSTNLMGIIESASTCLRRIPPLAASHSSSFVGHSSRRRKVLLNHRKLSDHRDQKTAATTNDTSTASTSSDRRAGLVPRSPRCVVGYWASTATSNGVTPSWSLSSHS